MRAGPSEDREMAERLAMVGPPRPPARAAAIALDSPRGARRWALVGFVVTIPSKREALRHYAWVQEQAWLRPAWWNRSGTRRPGLDIESEELPVLGGGMRGLS